MLCEQSYTSQIDSHCTPNTVDAVHCSPELWITIISSDVIPHTGCVYTCFIHTYTPGPPTRLPAATLLVISDVTDTLGRQVGGAQNS